MTLSRLWDAGSAQTSSSPAAPGPVWSLPPPGVAQDGQPSRAGVGAVGTTRAQRRGTWGSAAGEMLSVLTAASASPPLDSDRLYSVTSPPGGRNLPPVRRTSDEGRLMPPSGRPSPRAGRGSPGRAAARGSGRAPQGSTAGSALLSGTASTSPRRAPPAGGAGNSARLGWAGPRCVGPAPFLPCPPLSAEQDRARPSGWKFPRRRLLPRRNPLAGVYRRSPPPPPLTRGCPPVSERRRQHQQPRRRAAPPAPPPCSAPTAPPSRPPWRAASRRARNGKAGCCRPTTATTAGWTP